MVGEGENVEVCEVEEFHLVFIIGRQTMHVKERKPENVSK